MDNPATPAAATPVESAPQAPQITTYRGPCAGCAREVEVREKSYWPLKPSDYDSKIVCSCCQADRRADQSVKERESSLRTAQQSASVLREKVLPLLRTSGIECSYIYLGFVGEIVAKAYDRESGLQLAGVLGRLLETPHRWKKTQEYNEASFKLSGDILVAENVRIELAITNVAPSPSCRIVEEEVHVPARIEKRRKIVCSEDVEVPQS